MTEDYIFYSEEVQNAVSLNELEILSEEPEYARNSLQAILYARTNQSQTVKEVYRNMIATSLRHHTKDYIFSKIKIIIQIAGLPFFYFYQVFFAYDKEQVYVVTRMWERDWISTFQFLRAGGAVFISSSVLILIAALKSLRTWKKWLFPLLYGFISIISIAAPTISAGKQNVDYRIDNSAFCIWVLVLLAVLFNLWQNRQKGFHK